MSADNTKIRRITAAAVATVAVALLSGCATHYSLETALERQHVGENKYLVLVRGIHPLREGEAGLICKDGVLPENWKAIVDTKGQTLAFVKSEICPTLNAWRWFSGFTKSDFRKGNILAGGYVRPGLKVDVDDIVEVSSLMDTDGRTLRPELVTRVVRKNVLKERDPSCYWAGQSGPLDSFATGGVVCPAEGWDWRNQKWAKK